MTKFKGGLTSGATLVSFGIVFLADNIGIADVSVTWPLILVSIGLALVIRYMDGRIR